MSETHSTEPFLAARLRERIRREGPITFRDWMEAALYDERDGYYCRRDLARWGRAGDYRTSPERSPLFAATFAGYFARLYEELGSPGRLTIFEAGAGEGHFALEVLQTFKRDYPEIFAATRYVIDEKSADARERAGQRLRDFNDHLDFLSHEETCAPVPEGIIFSNELVDALPVHRVTMRGGKLYEMFVCLDSAGGFSWVEGEPSSPRLALYLKRSGVELFDGQVAEINLEAEDFVKRAVGVFKRGYLITVDYGAEAQELYGSPGRGRGTLRAFYRHRFADEVFENPGMQDLTTTVDWTNFKRVGEELGLKTIDFDRQDAFLLRVGLLEQLERLTAVAKSEADALVLRSGVREMILPGGMSESFQVLVQQKGN